MYKTNGSYYENAFGKLRQAIRQARSVEPMNVPSDILQLAERAATQCGAIETADKDVWAETLAKDVCVCCAQKSLKTKDEVFDYLVKLFGG